MHPTDDDLKEFMALYAAAFKTTLSLAQAREIASRVTQLYEALAEPLPSERQQPHTSLDDPTDSPLS